MKRKPVVSIIVPIYNIQNYVARCVKSLTSQSFADIEIILIDDGSTDKSSNIAEELKKGDDRVTVIHQQNRGLSSARNIGLEAALGKYILFVDGDDYLDDSEAIKILVDTAEKNKTDVVLFPYKKIYKNREENALLPIKSQGLIRDVRKGVLRKLIGPTVEELSCVELTERLNTAWGKLYRRDIIGEIRFENTRVIGAEDGWFNIEVFFRVNRAWYQEDVYYCYEKRNETSLLHQYQTNYYIARKNAYVKIADFLVRNDLTKWNSCLSNRIISEIPGFLSKICRAKISFGIKQKELKKILSDETFKEALEKLSTDKISGVWKYFYILCKHQNVFVLVCLGDMYVWKKRICQ